MFSQEINSFSCYLIGGDSLLIECAEVLLTKGHNIRGVITSAPRLSQWAMSKSITVIAADKNYPTTLIENAKTEPFDYLFSITHLAIINDEVLALPQKMTINFHDGPLPAYAGLNAPAWALMNQEEQYGISWHKVVPGIDEGELLKQSNFDITAGETSLSINTKCFAAALESFPVLVDELCHNQTQPISQDLSKRSYFGKYQRPEAMGFLSWEKNANALAAFIKALNFGEYPNLLTTPKVVINNTTFTIADAVAQEQNSSEEAGTVIAADDNSIDIATVDGVLSITQLTTLFGEKIILPATDICAGDNFNVITPDTQNLLSETNQTLCRQDEFWSKRLATLDPIEIPYSNRESSKAAKAEHYSAVNIEIPSAFTQAFGVQESVKESAEEGAKEGTKDNFDNSVEQKQLNLAAVFTLLLARLGRKFEFDVALTSSSISATADIVNGLISDRLSAYIDVDLQSDSTALLANIGRQLSSALNKGTWVNDIVGRYPNLNALPELADGSALPVAIAFNDQPLLGSVVTLAVNNNAVKLFYDTRRLSEAAATQIKTQYSALMNNMSAVPELPCGEIELLSNTEKHRLLGEWNQTQLEYDSTQCIHQLFEEQVLIRPNATAVVFEGDSVTYAELNQLANNLAGILIEKNVQPDELVGVNVERSIDLLVATLGVMKAGAAYVPLDPAFPADRISYMVSDAKMRLIITQSAIEESLPASKAEIICVDNVALTDKTLGDSQSQPKPGINSGNLAYVIYTSGSTGNPKGVMVEHRNVVNFFLGMDGRIDHNPPGTWLAVTSLSFDISVLELFWTLTRGFKVVVYKEDRGAEKTMSAKKIQRQAMQFGLFMWGNDDAPGSSKYKLMIDGAKYFDENNFDAVWTPERHFSAFGGPYPNPAVTSAAIAAITNKSRIVIRGWLAAE